jgi:hypothetical protein
VRILKEKHVVSRDNVTAPKKSQTDGSPFLTESMLEQSSTNPFATGDEPAPSSRSVGSRPEGGAYGDV